MGRKEKKSCPAEADSPSRGMLLVSSTVSEEGRLQPVNRINSVKPSKAILNLADTLIISCP
jgi:hypothetical protein